MRSKKKNCSRCLFDETIPNLILDENHICKYCRKHDILIKFYSQNEDIRAGNLNTLLKKVKKASARKKYDVIVGVSGGVDSSYMIHKVVELGLRPLAVYFDNNWGSKTSLENIKKITKKLDVDLYTYVVNWEEFKNIQKAFLHASVPCVEVPTDLAISSVLYQLANKEGVKYIFTGASFITEGTVPLEWSFIDGSYIKSVCREYGIKKFIDYPFLSLTKLFYYTFIKKIIQVPFNNFYAYDKLSAKKFLAKNYFWEDYGGHHYENIYSKWAFGWYTFNKFGFDKRKVSLSGPVRMGELTKKEALKMIKTPPEISQETTDYVVKKLGLKAEEFTKIMKAKPKTFKNFNTSMTFLFKLRKLIRLSVKMGFISPVVYEKFFDE